MEAHTVPDELSSVSLEEEHPVIMDANSSVISMIFFMVHYFRSANFWNGKEVENDLFGLIPRVGIRVEFTSFYFRLL